MFIIDSFQLVFGGFATLAASVGYACTRSLTPDFRLKSTGVTTHATTKFGRSVSQSSEGDLEKSSQCVDGTKSLCESSAISTEQTSTVPEPVSLKRKHSEDDDYSEDTGYPHNVPSMYPNKRSRTPSSDDDSELIRTPPLSESLTFTSPPILVTQEESPPTYDDACADQIRDLNQPTCKGEAGTPVINSTLSSPHLPSRPGTPRAQPTASSNAKPTKGFAAFAGTQSFFGTAVDGSSFPVERSIWGCNAEAQRQVSQDPLTAETHSESTYTHLTGEEGEDVESELKGVKLFVNRGHKGFNDGMFGHVKLLSNKKTQSQRLLFRREPLWQVSVNLGLNPLVRCTFDEEAFALRLILKESVNRPNVPLEQRSSEVVIYVIKRGRVTKEAFREFAEVLSTSSHLTGQL